MEEPVRRDGSERSRMREVAVLAVASPPLLLAAVAAELGHVSLFLAASSALVGMGALGAALSIAALRRSGEAQRRALEQRVAERTAELEDARLQAESASRAKTRFLTNMSHEIRTPMTAILGYTDLILEFDDQLGERGRELLEIVRRNGDYLLEIINDTLDLAKIEAGRLELEPVSVDLVRLLAEIASLMRVRSDQKEIELALAYDSPIPRPIICDPTRVRQVIVNLVGNAIKFTEQGSVTVHVCYDADRQEVQVEVVDTGVGIPDAAVPTLFQQFEQGDNSTSRRFGGTGLGLAIVRGIADLMDGECSVESAVGVGSTFGFRFRAAPAADAEFVSVDAEAALRIDPVEPAPSVDLPSGVRILLAEDGLDNQRLIAALLQKAGARVTVVENGRLAVDELQRGGFDVVLMDMAMPVMDGYTATRTLRDLGFDLPVIAVTAHALTGERERCLAAGCDDYVTKPIDRPTLLGRVRAQLERKHS
jgi:Amt family ammonium transporter